MAPGANLALWLAAAVILSSVLGATRAGAQSDEEDAHIAIENPATLTKDEARRTYIELMERMNEGYALSRLAIVRDYQSWTPYNDAPYVSSTHGQRFVNNYANRVARNYGTLQSGETMPAGSVLAKDSMTVTEDGRIFPGALFVMEKLPEGTSPETADWRYVMVIPDGSLFGDTIGDQPDAVTYCHACHEAVADRDYTFFVPEDYRVDE